MNQKDRLLILDFDGVLNCEQYMLSITDWDGNQFDPIAVARLNKIIEATDAKIVVSSSWRLDPEFKSNPAGVGELLKRIGVVGEWIANTPVLNTSNREEEIWEYLDENYGKIESLVILDDDPLVRNGKMDPLLIPFFVKTTWALGLQDEHVEKAIHILNEEKWLTK